VFGQATWNATSRLKLTLGLRYTHEKKEGAYNQFWVAGTDPSTLSPAAGAAVIAIRNQFNPVTAYSTSFTDDSVSLLANLSYKIAPDALIYATYSRGSKSGGLNLTSLPAGVTPDVRPERVNAYEVGLKAQALDKRLTANLAAFWTDISDYQTAITEQAPGGLTYRQYISNIPSVRSRGAEADLSFAPTRLVSLNASASYTDAVYIDYPNAPQAPERLDLGSVQSLSGKPLAGVPKFTYTLGADIAQPVGRIAGQTLQFYGHADFAHRSLLNTSSTNSRYAQVPGYGVLNGRIGVRPESGRWDLSVWARNLTNTKYFQTLAAANTGVITALLGDPRTVGATLRIKL